MLNTKEPFISGILGGGKHTQRYEFPFERSGQVIKRWVAPFIGAVLPFRVNNWPSFFQYLALGTCVPHLSTSAMALESQLRVSGFF